ncbi:hypothetical protein BWI92_25665 [Flectobacillus sp. BAB-3569]|nr:hypothetical protein BWI92_25665 [Flectobacillus sp. BAB-3569]
MINNIMDNLLAIYDEKVSNIVFLVQDLLLKHLPRIEEDVDLTAKLISYSYGKGVKGIIM